MSLKDKVLLGGWISKAVKVWRKFAWSIRRLDVQRVQDKKANNL